MMKRSRKRWFAAVIVLFVFALAMPVYAEPADIQGHWAQEDINRWIDRGILQGDQNGNFNPNNTISRAEFAAVLNRVFGYREQSDLAFSDIKGSEWYAADINKAATAGIVKGNGGKARPNDPVSRQEAAIMFARAFSLEAADKDAIKGFEDAASVPDWSREALCALVGNGYMAGQPGNIMAPDARISRAEVVKILDNITGELKSKPGTYTGTVERSLVVNTADVVLQSMVVNGDLYLTQGIGDGNVTLDNVTVKGRTIVNGGGDHSVKIVNSALNGKLIVLKVDGKIRIVAEGTTTIPEVLMQSGGILEENGTTGSGFGNVQIAGTILPGQEISLDGSFGEVSVEAAGVSLQVMDGTVGSMLMAAGASGSVVNIAETAVVEALTLDSAVEVKGKGSINNATFNCDGVLMEQTPKVVNAKEGIALPANLQLSEEGASGGGGGGLPGEAMEVLSASARIGGSWVEAEKLQDGVWKVNLSGQDPEAYFTDIKVNASANVVSGGVTFMEIFTYEITFSNGSGTANVHDMLKSFDTGEPGVSVQSILEYGETEFQVVLKNSGGNTKKVSIRLAK